MIIKSIFIVLIFLNLSQADVETFKTKIELVQILFRHGDRTPVMTYPNDLYNGSTWHKFGGYGQLTQTGMRQHYEFGKFLREHYANFLNKFYNKENVRVISTDFDRTLMSAYSLLNGLFTPVDFQVWKPNTKWQPVPVHTTAKDSDNIFYGAQCPRLKQLKKQIERTNEYLETNKRYQDIFNIVDKNSGCGWKSGCAHMNLDDEWKIADNLFVEKTNGLKLPDWVLPVYDRLIHSLGWGFYFMFRLPEMARLQSGGILRDMRKNFENKVNKENEEAVNSFQDQLHLYSGHDTYVAALSRLLNITSYHNQPPYASALALELHRQPETNNFFVQVYLKNNTAGAPINYRKMTMNGCHQLCPFHKFMEITESLVVHDFTNECKFKDKNVKSIYTSNAASVHRFYMNMAILILILSIITTGLIMVAFFRKSQSDLNSYKNLNEEEEKEEENRQEIYNSYSQI